MVPVMHVAIQITLICIDGRTADVGPLAGQ
jgi:hypothetical protein